MAGEDRVRVVDQDWVGEAKAADRIRNLLQLFARVGSRILCVRLQAIKWKVLAV